MRRKRDSLRASQKEILNKHRNPNSLKEFCLFYFPKKNTNKFGFFGKEKTHNNVVGFFLRRKRDSNPRTCYSQQFSRLPHSTALPFLQKSYQICPDCGCKYGKVFYSRKQKSDYFLSLLNIIKYSIYLIHNQVLLQ